MSVLNSTMSMFDRSVRKNDHRRHISRSNSMPRSPRRERKASTAVPKPNHPGSMMRASDQLKTHGTQVLNALGCLAVAGAATDVEICDFADRGGGAEEVDKSGGLVNQLAIGTISII